MEHVEEVYAIIEEWTLQHEKREAMRLLAGAGVPCSYVFDTLDLFTDEHLVARDFIKTVDHPVNGPVRLMRHPLRMPGAAEIGRAPLLGEHTDEVLAQLLGYDDATLAELRKRDITRPRLDG